MDEKTKESLQRLAKVPFTDFVTEGTKRWDKGSHLHRLKAIPNEKGNRAERREAKKRKKK